MKIFTFYCIFGFLLLSGCEGGDADSPREVADSNVPAVDGALPSSDAGASLDANPGQDAGNPPADAGEELGFLRIEVRTGEASVLMQVTDVQANDPADLDLTLYSATIRFEDSDGNVLATDTQDLGSQLSGPGWVKTLWWPADPLPTQAEVVVMSRERNQPPDEAEAIATSVIAITPVPTTEAGCSPDGFADRCPTGQGCLVDEGGAGTCQSLEVHVWGNVDGAGMDNRATVDVRSDAPDSRANVEVFLLSEETLSRSLLRRHTTATGWRATASGSAPGAAFSFFFGPHLYAADMALETPPRRALGESCDPLRVADQCADGTACNDAEECGTSTPPVLDTLNPYYDYDREILVIEFTGQDLEQNIRRLDLELQPAGGGETEPFVADVPTRRRHNTRWGAGQVNYSEDGRFTGTWFVTRDANAPTNLGLDSDIPARSRLTLLLTDTEGHTSGAPLGATILPALPADEVGEGAPCDLSQVLATCTDGTFCALAQGDSSARCHVAPAACNGPWELQRFTPPMVAGDLSEGPDETIGFCSRQRGDLGAEQVFEFIPEATGIHTFRFVGSAATLFIRRHCALRGTEVSEFACARAEQPGQNTFNEPVSLEATLEAGVPVYLFMEAAWSGGGPYTLSVESP